MAVITGIGRTDYSRRSGRTTLAMAVEACRAAVADAGLQPTDVDGMTAFHVNDSTSPLYVSHAMGIDDLAWFDYQSGGGNLVANVVATAVAAVDAGLCRNALVFRSLNGRSGYRMGVTETAQPVGGMMQYWAPHGYLAPAMWIAMFARRHMAVFDTTYEDFGEIAITTRAHAEKNAHAIARDPLTMDDYFAGRMIFDPFRVYDCSYEVDGAVALLVSADDVAADTRQPPVHVLGQAQALSGSGWDEWPDLSTMYSVRAGPRLWRNTGLSPNDIDVACMYDCFTITTMATLEGFGLVEQGAVGDFYREGRATYGGDVVVNPHGGLLSEGYIHGLNHHYEAVLQLRGQAEHRQVSEAQTALVTAGAGPFGGAVVYGKEAA